MKSQKPSAHFTKMLFALLLFCAALALLVNGILTSSIAQSKEEREVEDKIPKHVPIKIKLKTEKEKAFKDLKNANWQRDFELEVTNTSNKPIYFLELWVEYPEVITGNGHRLGVPLRYGRFDFIHFDTRPIPADIHIEPGGTHVFMIPDQDQRGWQAYKVRENREDPKKVEITFTQLSYGDGSGFNGSDAKPYPYKRDQSSNRPCREGPKEGDHDGFRNSARIPFPALRRAYSLLPTPAAILPVNFFLVETSYRQPEVRDELINTATSFATAQRSKTRMTRSLAVGRGMFFLQLRTNQDQKLSQRKLSHRLQRIDLGNRLVRSQAYDARKAQSVAALVTI